MGLHWTVEVFSILLIALGAYVAFGPYHDDRTWNLVRNSAKIETIPVPSQEPTHFSLYALEHSTSKPSLLFIPGHAGSWRQGINLCAYLEGAWNFYVTDFHASASALHWSVLSDQAAFTAAAINHLGELRGSQLTLLGHSMGGRVALEALKTSRQHVNALILISTPVGPHPLLLDPRFAPEAGLDLQGLDVYSLSGGATDPLVPMKSCRERSVRFIPLPAASNVYSSFSHVNLLFSRHSLHFLARLLRGATSPKREVPLSPWLRLNSFTESTPAVQPKVLENISAMDPVKVTSLATVELAEGKMRLWKQPKMGGTFSFLLLEEPRPIRRRPESTTRGETFEATDTLNCSEISLTWRQQDTEQWHVVPFMDMQFPAKVCLFQLRQRSAVATEVLLSSQAPPKRPKRPPQRRAWAQWHADPQATVNCSAALPGLLGWFTTLLWPLRCEFPAGRALMTRLVLPLPQLPILPLDFRLSEVSLSEEQKNATLWPLILVSAEREEDVRIAALRLHTTPTSSGSWASESRPASELFAPRFVEPKEAFSIFVIGHPELEITVEVQGNIYSALAEFLRTQHFHNWLGACTCFSAQDLSTSRFARHSFPLLWIICTVLLQLLTEVSTSPLIAASCKVLDALMALGLASASRRFALFVSAVCRPRDRGYISTMAVILMASIQPAGCTLLLIIACVAQCGATKASPLLGTSSLLLGPYLLCQLPSMIFAVWLLLGQHKEASAPFLQSKLDRALPSSQHLPTLWADSWLSKDPDLRPVLSLLAPSVTLCCCMAKGPSSAPKAAEWAMLTLSVAVTVYAASSSRLWWACQPVFLAQMLVALASSPKQAKVD